MAQIGELVRHLAQVEIAAQKLTEASPEDLARALARYQEDVGTPDTGLLRALANRIDAAAGGGGR